MQALKNRVELLRSDALHRNSFFLIAANALMAGFGFFYWLIVARLYTAENVGLATAIFSLGTLLANLSTFGLRLGIMHYLPASQEKNRLMNTVLNLTIVLCTVIAIVTLLVLNVVSPKLLILRSSIPFLVMFMAYVILSGVSYIVEGIFLVFRSAEYILIEDAILFGVKLLLPLGLVAFATFGIFSAWCVGLMIAEFVCIIILMRKFKYKPMFLIDLSLTRKIAGFAFWGHVTAFLSSLPAIIVPIIITNLLRQRDAAYFYMDLMIVTMLYVISQAMGQALFVEGSYDKNSMVTNVKKVSRSILLILVPSIIGILLFGNLILSILGADYAREGYGLLVVLSISAIPVSVFYIGQSLLTVNHRQRAVAVINLIAVVLVVLLSYVFADKGLIGIGYAWLIAYSVCAVLYLGAASKSAAGEPDKAIQQIELTRKPVELL